MFVEMLAAKKSFGVFAAVMVGYFGVVIADAAAVASNDSWHIAFQKIAEHGILAILVAALMWMNWLRENRQAQEAVNRDKATREEFSARIAALSQHEKDLQSFIQGQLMSLIEKTHDNIHSCHQFRGHALNVLSAIEPAKHTPAMPPGNQ